MGGTNYKLIHQADNMYKKVTNSQHYHYSWVAQRTNIIYLDALNLDTLNRFFLNSHILQHDNMIPRINGLIKKNFLLYLGLTCCHGNYVIKKKN